ncbi:helix-turn-helix domain-containing protein [Flavisolibacter nicotianae]|uniref:helix-turn-helix domain-containing protein n=1 Tax=Flavisolibacter nicotianae TaxID=2364882 RepID=UPI000EB2923A|nr:MerR family transcriptional regulator [Flavisolibacter nicotianae]
MKHTTAFTPSSTLLIPDAAFEQLAPLFTKDYSQEALSFLKNYHRVLNYWAEGIDILPPQLEEGKRRRFSFFDLVWLGIVRELREYGMEKEKIAVLKEELFAPFDNKEVLRQLKLTRKETEAQLAKMYGVATSVVKPILDEYFQKQADIQALGYSKLSIYLYNVLGTRLPFSLWVSKEGKHRLVFQNKDGILFMGDEGGPMETSYLMISLNGVMGFFAGLELVSDTVRQAVLTQEEWQLIQETRKEGLKSITVHFKDGKPQTLESTRRKKIAMEARLTEVLLKGGYENLTIVTEKGQIVYAEKTTKKRFTHDD